MIFQYICPFRKPRCCARLSCELTEQTSCSTLLIWTISPKSIAARQTCPGLLPHLHRSFLILRASFCGINYLDTMISYPRRSLCFWGYYQHSSVCLTGFLAFCLAARTAGWCIWRARCRWVFGGQSSLVHSQRYGMGRDHSDILWRMGSSHADIIFQSTGAQTWAFFTYLECIPDVLHERRFTWH